MNNSYMGDFSGIRNVGGTIKKVEHTTDPKAGQSLDMTDFLTLMVAMFQNQDIDNAASTADMMNQMVQMSVVQAITDISSLITESSVMTYAASLVGKDVTVGKVVGGKIEEIYGTVTGTGTLGGQQVIFLGDDCYYLNEIMAVGRLPEEKEETKPGEGESEEGNTEEGSKVNA